MGKALRVLIVEDSEDDVLLLLRELQRGGYEVEFERVETAEAMQSALVQKTWDLILSDYSLPEFNAPQALEVLKASGLDLPFIIISGTIGEETAVAALKAGAHDFLVKGKFARLGPAIERELREAETRRERRRAERALREREQQLSSIYNTAADVLFLLLVGEEGRYRFVSVNQSFLTTTGLTEDQVIGRHVDEVIPEPALSLVLGKYSQAIQEKRILRWEETSDYPKGRLTGEVSIAPAFDETGTCTHLVGAVHDITERKQAEEALQEKERLLSEAQRIGHVGSWSYNILNDTLQFSDEMYRLLDVSRGDFQHNREGFLDLIYSADRPEVTKWMTDIRAGRQVKELDFRIFHRNSELRYIQVRGAVIFDSTGKPARFTGTAQDVSERKLAEIQIRQQIDHLNALRTIDQAISSSFKLSSNLDTVLAQTITQLQVDAADILLLDPGEQMLEYAAGQGFRTRVIESSRVPLGESYAGRAVKERRLIRVENLKDEPHGPILSALLAGEGFVCYFGVPLITKGKVKGVLEVFHRLSLEPYQEWIDFLETLAGQAAIAIENATLFENLQQSNRELLQAYDATIEGWSHAMDLRDKETEGHSLRVTQMTLDLARKFKFTEEQLQNIRWGALLHDIGKMGIPDNILLKPDKLTEEEWGVMRKHPVFAFEMLSPIAHLKPSLDIPYCHHEKWDGTGYPRALKGDEISLTARLFAVVDVWDALRSDRPYRKAWSIEETSEYIRAQAGTHFEPKVVEHFLEMIGRSNSNT